MVRDQETVGLTDILFLKKIFERGIQFVGRQLDAAQVCNGVGPAVVEQGQDLLHGRVETGLRHLSLRTMAQTDIALAAVVVVLLAEIAQQLTAAADLVFRGVAYHGLDAPAELFLPFLIDGGRQLHVLHVLAPLGIADIGCLLLWNEVQDMALAQTLQGHVDLMGLEGRLLGDETLVDIVVVGEESAVVTQQGRDDLFLISGSVLQAVQVVAAEGEHHAGLVVLFFRVFDIARPAEDLQGRVYLDGEMAEGVAELVDVEFEGVVIAGADADLVEVGEVLVDLSDVVFLRKCVGDALLQLAFVGVVVEQDGIGLEAVTTGTAGLLEIGLDTVGTVDVDDESYVGLVDAHAEGVGGHHHAGLTLLPGLLSFILHGGIETGVVEGGGDARLGEYFGNLLGAPSAAGIDDGGAFHAVEDVDEFFALVGGIAHDVGKVLALE